MKNSLNLKDSLEIMKKINQSKNYNCYFHQGKMCIESKIVTIINPMEVKHE